MSYVMEFKAISKDTLRRSLDVIMKHSGKILVYFDPDVDGAFSGLFMCWFLDRLGKRYMTYINEKREHGFKLELSSLESDLLIISVDFSIPQDLLQSLVDSKMSIINIDHHDLLENWGSIDGTYRALCINCLFEDKQYHFMSAGVLVYHVLDYWYTLLDKEWDFKDECFALSGITLFSDVRPIENDLARQHLEALELCQTPFVDYLIKNTNTDYKTFGAPRLDRLYVDFTLSPSLNAAFRCNEGKLVIDFLLQRYPIQDGQFAEFRKIQKQIETTLPLRIKIKEQSSTLVVVCDATGAPNLTAFIGLYANRLLSKYRKSVMILAYDNGEFIRGSFRGRYDLDYKGMFRAVGIPAEGHLSAFGIQKAKGLSVNLGDLDNRVCVLEKGVYSSMGSNIITVNNLALFPELHNIARDNKFVRTPKQTVIKYTGDDISVMYMSDKFKRWKVDGFHVQSFTPDLQIKDGIILPIEDKGYLSLTLKSD